METKHSTGPWDLQPWTTYDNDGAIEACGFRVADADGNAISAGHLEGASEQEEADSRLIAAAPELLVALDNAVDSLDYVQRVLAGSVGFGVRAERIKAARAAIAKATGAT